MSFIRQNVVSALPPFRVRRPSPCSRRLLCCAAASLSPNYSSHPPPSSPLFPFPACRPRVHIRDAQAAAAHHQARGQEPHPGLLERTRRARVRGRPPLRRSGACTSLVFPLLLVAYLSPGSIFSFWHGRAGSGQQQDEVPVGVDLSPAVLFFLLAYRVSLSPACALYLSFLRTGRILRAELACTLNPLSSWYLRVFPRSLATSPCTHALSRCSVPPNSLCRIRTFRTRALIRCESLPCLVCP